MSSSPLSVKLRSPKRTAPKRTPLQERTSSETNELSNRLSQEPRSDQGTLDIYNSTPFPTKPAHVLLPSTIRKKKSFGLGQLADISGQLYESESGRSSDAPQNSRGGGSKPTVRLKRSVKALRDLYESQAEEASRPSTATSPALRPSTANSVRLRSISSSESLSGAYGWESLQKISADDLALLPSLPPGLHTVKRISSRSSFTSIPEKVAATSTPNYKVLATTSSPRLPSFRDLKGPSLEAFDEVLDTESEKDGSSSPNVVRLAHTSSPKQSQSPNGSSSPNVVRLAHSSSTEQFQSSDQSSSPNVVRLAHTSSTEQFQGSDQSSSPNVIKLGPSSPSTARPDFSKYPTLSRSSSSSSRKRKRSESGEGKSFAERVGARNPLASSPPVHRYLPPTAFANASSPVDSGMPSSAPQSIQQTNESIDESSPVVRILTRDQPTSDSSSVADTHASLQAALSSSPPRIQYPIVRAPAVSQHAGLSVPKRNSRSMSTEGSVSKFEPRLSAVPSEGSWLRPRPASEASSIADDLDQYLNSEDLAPASTYIINEGANLTQIRLVPETEPEAEPQCDSEWETEYSHQELDPHHNEATDEVSALPSKEYAYRSPPLRPSRSNGYLHSSSNNSSQQSITRLNSMNSFTKLRHNRSRSNSLRPGSSGSTVSVIPVPTWARRYYSGFYRDSFQYLYTSGSYYNLRERAANQAPIPVRLEPPSRSNQAPIPVHLEPPSRSNQAPIPVHLEPPSRPGTSKSNISAGIRNFHQGMMDGVGGPFRPRKRPKLEARKSHLLPGVGPLVSNPVRAPAPAALASTDRRQSYPQTLSYPNTHSRSVSLPLHPADPRAHWAGVVEIHEQPHQDGRGSSYMIRHHSFAYSLSGSQSDAQTNQSVIHHPRASGSGNLFRRSWHRWSYSPHLHHDARLGTGSTVSRGFGFPFNTKSRWTTGVPDLVTSGEPQSPLHIDRRSIQVICFTAGFLIPAAWFVGAFLPLPARPASFGDIEKEVVQEQRQRQRQSYPQQQPQSRTQSLRYSLSQQFSSDRSQAEQEWESMDVLARLRYERHVAGVAELKFQNARWWRNLNRWMSAVGVVVCALVVVLAVLGTKHNWGDT
ncbi:uncharacterized protein Z520_04910 [Fonsecaea multimorphosa CBS 102226]|uniref:Serine-rich protein n=1 Tax=Fonsecaea multimorphosa CBS 102226 TaxID=1442371 RepID=A0A0D2K870_9EURO|nr:uncharacterized protein Z520_04910 [Fonsecaea multimorphosa CBS 102226]KIX99334.1 hypothetical protein Z520_04910 [Fonsecaea multimorphosa CBS 102226]OAL25664.1 hypothetical protein AYO22_04653 [Fonsecaea multimorphosa]